MKVECIVGDKLVESSFVDLWSVVQHGGGVDGFYLLPLNNFINNIQ